jgi:N-acetylgalactosamine-6-sulfatase
MPNWLDPNVVSLPRLLQQAGYRTAHFGKWHLGGGGLPHGDPTAPKPAEYGYDETRVWNGNGPTWKGTELWPAVRYMDDDREWAPASSELAVNATIDFISRHRDEAFFVNLWLKDPHEPLWPTDEQRERYRGSFEDPKQCYYSVLSDADFHVGRLLAYLEEAGLDESTLVIFSSDNGPENLNETTRAGITAGLKGRKRSLHEGGVRVPFIVRWPGMVPAGAVDEQSVLSTVDLLPTFSALAGVALPANYRPDGEDVSGIFSGKVHRRTKPLYWQWRFADNSGKSANWPAAAVRDDDWKLLVDPTGNRHELYNIANDPKEQTNLSTANPEILSRLRLLLEQFQP